MDRSCQRSAIRFKVLTLFTLAYAFKTADSSPYIEAKRDIYVLDDKGNLLQKRIDDNGETWYSSSDVNKLEILVNDGIKDNIVSSCILDTPTAKAQPQMKNKSLHFENIAMAVGFKHVHRHHIAARPHCVFDFVVPSINSSSKARLKGEFCTTEHITGGAAVGDYNNDGLQDIFFAVFDGRSVLYKNNGDSTFKDVTKETGVGPNRYANGAGWVDIDQDGDLDLYVTTVGGTQHYLYVNYGGRFKEESKNRSVSMEFPNKRRLAGFTPAFGDFDNDGYPDMYVTEWILHSLGKPSASRLLRNLGKVKPGYFEDVTEKAGVNFDNYYNSRGKTNLNAGTHTFGASFTDFDNDGLAELLVTADYGESRMFWNNGNMTFTDCTIPCGLKGEVDAMGHAIGDWNNDGNLEWFSTAIYDNSQNCEVTGCMFGNRGNKLFENFGNRTFQDASRYAGVHDGGWGWGAAFIDFNNDGYLDIIMTNGIDTPSTTIDDAYMKQRMRLFRNIGPNATAGTIGKMTEVSKQLGLKFDGQGRGLLKFDFDNDGDEDVVVVANTGSPVFYENIGGNNASWLRIRVQHRCGENNASLCDSYGARVVVTDPTGRIQTQEVGSSTHFLGQSEMTTHFGLFSYMENITVKVTWPATKQTVIIRNVKPKHVLRIVRPMGASSDTSFSSFQSCPKLQVKEIKQQPSMAKVVINNDRQSVSLQLHPAIPLKNLGVERFIYGVSLANTTVFAEVTIDARVYIRNKTVSSMCPSGRMWLPGMPVPKRTSKRLINGISNNMDHLYWGASGENLRRAVKNAYADDISMPAGACTKQQRDSRKCPYPTELNGIGSNRPPPRKISNKLFAQADSVISKRRISDLFVHYGQFLAHDTDFSSPLARFEFQGQLNEVWMPISVPKNDVHFDQDSTGNTYLPFVRSTYNRCTGQYPNGYPREQINKISAYIDGTGVYGSTLSRQNKLRSFKDGMMRLDADGLIPKNDVGLDNDNVIGRKPSVLRVAGDTRSNVAPGLIVLHTLFVREHNRLCNEYKAKNPQASDEEIFQYAKRIVIAELQAIAFREYIPALLGGTDKIPSYKQYNSTIDPGVSNVFATAAFRFGHSQVNSHIFRLDERGNVSKYGHALLRETYFHPERVANEGGCDPVFRGMVYFPAQETDVLMVDEMRNALFPVGRDNGVDLAATNIQRGRDHGLPDYNTVRKTFGLKAISTFSEITKDVKVSSKLRELYKDVNEIDLWVGGLAEDHEEGSEIGPTFRKVFMETLLRIRDADRFWYEKIFTKEEISKVEDLTLGKIIRLNTGFKDAPDNVFFATQYCKGVEKHQCVAKDQKNKDELQKKNTDLENEKRRLSHSLSSAQSELSHARAYHSAEETKLRTAAITLGVLMAIVLCICILTLPVAYKRFMKKEKGQNSSKYKRNRRGSDQLSLMISRSNSSYSVPGEITQFSRSDSNKSNRSGQSTFALLANIGH